MFYFWFPLFYSQGDQPGQTGDIPGQGHIQDQGHIHDLGHDRHTTAGGGHIPGQGQGHLIIHAVDHSTIVDHEIVTTKRWQLKTTFVTLPNMVNTPKHFSLAVRSEVVLTIKLTLATDWLTIKLMLTTDWLTIKLTLATDWSGP